MSVIDCVKGIETDAGIQKYDYESLVNLPVPDVSLTKKGEFADAFIVGQRFSQVNSSIDELKQKNTSEDESIEAIRNELNTVQENLNSNVQAINNTIGELKNAIGTLQSTVSQLQTDLQSLTTRVTALENKK